MGYSRGDLQDSSRLVGEINGSQNAPQRVAVSIGHDENGALGQVEDPPAGGADQTSGEGRLLVAADHDEVRRRLAGDLVDQLWRQTGAHVNGRIRRTRVGGL